MRRNTLKTIRFSPPEARELRTYLRRNPSFDSVSSLGRAAILGFIRERRQMELHPKNSARPEQQKDLPRPAFLWDYDLDEAQARGILQTAGTQRRWLMARILERLKLSEVLKYLTLEQIQQELPQLRLDPKIKRHWEEALRLWTQPSSKS